MNLFRLGAVSSISVIARAFLRRRALPGLVLGTLCAAGFLSGLPLGAQGMDPVQPPPDEQPPPPDLDPVVPVPPPFDTPAHSAAAIKALADSSCARSVGITAAEAAQWMNAPDCFGNSCAGGTDISAANASSDAKWASDCWACRNPDHFTSNPVGSWSGIGSLSSPLAPGWDARDNQAAQDQLMALATSLAASAQTDADRKVALKVAFQACHYATDRLACGHAVGNLVCDPTGAAVTQACRDFVNQNGPRISSGVTINYIDNLFGLNADVVPAIQTACSGGTITPAASFISKLGASARSCRDMLTNAEWAPSEGLGFAAAERFIRHHAAGVFLLGGGPQSTCNPACISGECLAGATSEPADAASIAVVAAPCSELLRQTCAKMPARAKVAHKVCDRTSTPRVRIDCRDAVPPPNSVAYSERVYTNCIDATAAAQLEPDPAGCLDLPGGGDGSDGPGQGPSLGGTTCHACWQTGAECGYADCPTGGFESCGDCASGLTCKDGLCGIPNTSICVSCQEITCGWDTSCGGRDCCDLSCPGSCPTTGDGGSTGGGGSDLNAAACATAGYWSDGACGTSAVCTGAVVMLKDGTLCFE